jgi:hypothetical protein
MPEARNSGPSAFKRRAVLSPNRRAGVDRADREVVDRVDLRVPSYSQLRACGVREPAEAAEQQQREISA